MTQALPSLSRDRPTEPGDDPIQGSLLRGTYRVGRVLGRGGMGTVFHGEHVRLRRPVAIKVLARHLIGDAAALARFRREAELVSQLQHPNIVEIFDFESTEAGEPYLVMEYLTGQSLADVLEHYGRLDARKAARLVLQVACGLQAAHRASIVHLDLKPANVFLVEVPGEGTLVKLLDFGIGQFLDAGHLPAGEHQIVGTPDYMSPEQALGQAARIDQQSDQYSLAVIAFETISGHPPFVGRSVAEVLERVIANEPVPLDRFVPEVPRAVGQVLRRGMAKEPRERFASVIEFASALLSAAGCTLPPPGEGRLTLRPLFEDASTPPPLSFLAPRPDGRYHAARELHATEPPGTEPATEPPGPEPETEPPDELETIPPARSLRSADAARLPDIDRVLHRAREALGFGDVDLAVSYAESAVHLGAVLGGRSRERVQAASTLLESIYLSRIGSSSARLVGQRIPSEPEVHISSEEAFLLSRLEAGASVEEMLDVSPLPKGETLRHLVALIRSGLVRSV